MDRRSARVQRGTLFRFGSVSEILDFCRERYPTASVRTAERDGDFLLLVRDRTGEFESLIVHFEGEQIYAVMLPNEEQR